MAAVLIPMAGLAGSAVDMSRLYLVKVRLQQACDAGALAGRKAMTDLTATTLEQAAADQANSFFTNNFQPGWMSTTDVDFTPTRTNDGRVAGEATAVVPMTVMKMFAMPDQTIEVTCEARLDVPDTDVLFILDTTGSMACTPADSLSTCNNYAGNMSNVTSYTRPTDSALGAAAGATGSANASVPGYPGTTAYSVTEKTGSRIAALRTAVVSFYNTMAANIQPGTHVRYGFVTYTSVVNPGRAIMDLNPKYMMGGTNSGTTTAPYQSREITSVNTTTANSTQNNKTLAQCNALAYARTPATGYSSVDSKALMATVSHNSGTKVCTITTTTYQPVWTYRQVNINVASYLTSASIADPTRIVGAPTASWAGCVEEKGDTSAGTSTFSVGSLPASIDSDIPSTATARWAPHFPEAIYSRTYNANPAQTSIGDLSNTSTNPKAYWTYTNAGNREMLKNNSISCGKPVRRISTMTLQDVTNYVNASDFKPMGYTYHDTGMIWGVRLLSPNGIFAADTAAWPNRPAPNRVIVFLTDGEMTPINTAYSMYGVETLDRRVSNGVSSPSLTDFHNARFLAACAKAKALNIDIFTVSIVPSGTSANTQMTSCANTGQALATSSGAGLESHFQAIARKIARLRLSQ